MEGTCAEFGSENLVSTFSEHTFQPVREECCISTLGGMYRMRTRMNALAALLAHPCIVTQQVIGANPCLATNHSSTKLLSITKQGTHPLDYPF
jgi:hypothetical protein